MPISEKDQQRLKDLAERYPKLFRGLILPWFTKEGWPKILAVAADRARLHDTFEDFERVSTSKFNELVAKGHPVEKVVVDADALIAWCKAEGRPLDTMARQEFAMMTLIERDKQAGHA
jgi:hypothetical protein